MRIKKTIALSILVVLYIGPIILMPYSTAPAIGNESQFAIAEGENWLIGWGYRKAIVITQAFGYLAETPYNIKLDLEWGVGTDSGNTIYLNGRSKTNFADVRFTDNDGNTTLDHWRREYTPSGDATFWIEVTDDLVDTTPENVTIYVYYSNSGATTASNGTATFLYFDDFESGNLDKWNVTNMEIKSDRVLNGDYSAGVDSIGTVAHLAFDTSLEEEFLSYHISVNAQQALRGSIIRPYTRQDESEIAGYLQTSYEADPSKLYYYDGAFKAWTLSSDDINSDIWYDFEIKLHFDLGETPLMRGYHNTSNSFELHYDGEEDLHTPADVDPSYSTLEWLKFTAQANYECWYDDFFIRYTAYFDEPTVNITLSEESVFSWANIDTITAFLQMPMDEVALNWFLIFGGLALIPASTTYLAWGGRKGMSQDKLYYGCIALMLGLALFIGGIYAG